MYTDEKTLGELFNGVAADLGELAELHVALARAEAQRDAKEFARDVLPIAIGIPVFVIGWVVLCFAIAAALVPSLGLPGALLLVAAVHLVAGAVAAGFGYARLRQGPLVTVSIGPEVKQTAQIVNATRTTRIGENNVH